MIAPAITALCLLAAAPSPAQRCEKVWKSFEAEPKVQKELLEPLKARPGVAEKLKAHFLENCATKSPESFECAEKTPGLAAIKGCQGIGEAFALAMTHPDVIDPKEFERYRLRSMQGEAKVMLKSMSTGLKMLMGEQGAAAVGKLAPAGPSPTQDCCKTEGRCAPDAKAWEHPTWKAIMFSVMDPARYHYSLEVKGKALTLRAKGDPTCTGKEEIWETKGTIQGDQIEFGEATQVK